MRETELSCSIWWGGYRLTRRDKSLLLTTSPSFPINLTLKDGRAPQVTGVTFLEERERQREREREQQQPKKTFSPVCSPPCPGPEEETPRNLFYTSRVLRDLLLQSSSSSTSSSSTSSLNHYLLLLANPVLSRFNKYPTGFSSTTTTTTTTQLKLQNQQQPLVSYTTDPNSPPLYYFENSLCALTVSIVEVL